MRRTLIVDAGLVKLEEFVLGMAPGDEMNVTRAAEISGLNRKHCDRLLGALMRAGLIMRLQHDAYVRCRLQVAEALSA